MQVPSTNAAASQPDRFFAKADIGATHQVKTMSMTDPIADMLVRIKNAAAVGKQAVKMLSSKIKVAIANVPRAKGIADARVTQAGAKAELKSLEVFEGKPVIETPSACRALACATGTVARDALPKVLNGPGVAIISTSKGIMTDSQARQQGVGGEVPASWPKGETTMSRVAKACRPGHGRRTQRPAGIDQRHGPRRAP